MLNYPLKFKPILMDRLWGGTKLITEFKKEGSGKYVGESWEVSDVQNQVSEVANGIHEGKSLRDLLKSYGPDLVGKKVYDEFGDRFPLLIKYIDAREDLSIQVHPNNELSEARHGTFGKTEMWYVMQADPGSELVLGFSKVIDKKGYINHLINKSIASIMNYEPVQAGDVFFIDTGTVHAIGGGIVLAEIQQTSDITYRIYDWDRTDADGNPRELHTELALDAIDFKAGGDCRRRYEQGVNRSNPMVDSPFFCTKFLPIAGTLQKDYTAADSFVIFMCVKGDGTLSTGENTVFISKGETVLLPACMPQVVITSGEGMELLEVSLP
jgi:mannose-6-phosphate isomerase